jgi:hypothetical protein
MCFEEFPKSMICWKFISTINEVNKVMQEKDAAFKGIEANLQEKDREIEELRHNDKVKEDALATLSDQVMKLMVEVQELKKQK